MSEEVVEKASALVLVLVVLAVLVALFRLVLEHWAYSILIVAVAIAAWYLNSSVKRDWKH
jgi:Flp pilus assembly protein TadB